MHWLNDWCRPPLPVTHCMSGDRGGRT